MFILEHKRIHAGNKIEYGLNWTTDLACTNLQPHIIKHSLYDFCTQSQTNATLILVKTEACVQNWSLIMNARVHMVFEAKVVKVSPVYSHF